MPELTSEWSSDRTRGDAVPLSTSHRPVSHDSTDLAAGGGGEATADDDFLEWEEWEDFDECDECDDE